MNGVFPGRSATAVELRRAFDAAFAQPPTAVGAMAEDLLGLGFAGDSYAVRLGAIAGLFKDRRVTSLPSRFSDFLGVAAIQGNMVSVYDLGSVLGHSPTTNPRWLLLILTPEPVGLAFEVFEGQFRVPRELIAPTSAGSVRHVSGAVRTADLVRHVIDIASVVEAIRSQAGPAGPAKER